MRMRLIALVLLGYLASAALAKADAIYSMNDQTSGYSWSFDVPAILTTTTSISSFLSTKIVPGGNAAGAGCTAIGSVEIFLPSSFSIVEINTNMTCSPSNKSFTPFFNGPITSFNTFASTSVNATLTISPSAATPEPSSLLLLVAGLSAFGARRRLARTRTPHKSTGKETEQ
jgi:hypothetical protein